MKLLVAGGAGYVGSVVAKQLVEAGHAVTVMDDLSKGHRGGIPTGAEFEPGSLLDRERVSEVLVSGFDGVLHFAARSLVGESVAEPEMYYENNVLGTLNLLRAAGETGVKHFVFSSTAATYGEPEEVPITEGSPTVPTNPYGSTKLACDRMISEVARARNIAATSLRYFNVAGASGELGEDHDPETHLIPLVLRAALGKSDSIKIFGTDYATPDGTAVRDYIHIEDLARAHLLALESPDGAKPGEHRIYNLGNGSGYSVREVIEAARAVTGKEIEAVEAPRRAGDPPVLVASSERIRAELGWRPEKPTLRAMISDAWSWMQQNPDGYGD